VYVCVLALCGRVQNAGRECRFVLTSEYGFRECENIFVHEDPLGGHEEKHWVHFVLPFLRAFFPKPSK
jgi:hypothetical protein